MSKKILLFARDPGGARSLIPLVEPLQRRGYTVLLLGKDYALSEYADRNVPGWCDIARLMPVPDENALGGFLRSEAFDFIITGTSADDMTEKYLWQVAGRLGIPCFAVLDQWINYGLRFSSFGVSALRSYNQDRKHPYLPTKIIVMDEYAREEMVRDGIPSSCILVCGQPHFEYLAHDAKCRSGRDVRRSLQIDDADYIITFASEPITKTYRERDEVPHYWGYTERTIFRSLMLCLKTIAPAANRRICLIVRPHPKEDTEGLADLCSLAPPGVRILRDSKSPALDLIGISHLICGMSSMFLLESSILGKPILSIQIGLSRDDPFMLSRRGITATIRDEVRLMHTLWSAIVDNVYVRVEVPYIQDPIFRIIQAMEEILCQN